MIKEQLANLELLVRVHATTLSATPLDGPDLIRAKKLSSVGLIHMRGSLGDREGIFIVAERGLYLIEEWKQALERHLNGTDDGL